ncbi:MAG: PilZ domain-containing protein [Firmicutes bacterium]|nr:PilZ domain-containing protein [Bacillota bacterium]
MENIGKIKELLYPGKNVQIEAKNSEGHKLVQKAQVQRLDDLYLALSLSGQGNIFECLKTNTELAVVCRHPQEQTDYVFFTQFIRVVGSSPTSALTRTPTGFNKGRQAARFDVTVPFSYFLNHQEFKEGVVQNLSMNGLLAAIEPNQEIKAQDRLAVKLSLPNAPFPILLSGKITRIAKQGQKYQIAMHFPYLAFDIQDQIVKFLFSAQKKNLFRVQKPETNFPDPAASNYRKIG